MVPPYVLIAATLLLGCDSQSKLGPDVGLDTAQQTDSAPAPIDLGADAPIIVSDIAIDAPTTPSCWHSLIPAPCQPGFDPDLEALATDYERSFHLLSAASMGVWADLVIEGDANRTLVEDFLRQSESWDFHAETGKHAAEVVTRWNATAGLYAGVGIAADAFRYGVLRDQGYPQAEVQRARQYLLDGLETLHLAAAITGVPGVIARGLIRTDMPSSVPVTTPLFDAQGNALPPEKDNGTWREDNSGGLYPNYLWVDSCSRDMLLGWVTAYGAAWEVIAGDASIPPQAKQRLQQAAKELGYALKMVRESGFDLELMDADGRTTYHGYLHEDAFDRVYLPNPFVKNGANAIMALGIVATLVYVSEDQELEDYLDQTLVGARKLHEISRDQLIVDAGPRTNYSGTNMAFTGAWLATRYLKPGPALIAAREALQKKLYDNAQGLTQPQALGWKQSLFDLVAAAGQAEASAYGPTSGQVNAQAVTNGLETLNAFPRPPYWDREVINCDADELDAFNCLAIDGSTLIVINPIADRSDDPQSLFPMPFHLRPPSNYDWRSNPFRVNGSGSPGRMISGVDFRLPYWLGRWVRR